jgi:branched-chain amino acid transport system permease protein
MKPNRRKFGGAIAIVAGIALLAALPWLVNPYYTSVAIIIGLDTIITVGLCLLMGYTGQVSLGQAAFYGIGAYTSAILSKQGLSPWLAMVVAAAATGAFAYIVGKPVLRLKGNYLAMATLGLGIIVYIFLREADWLTEGQRGILAIPYLSIGGFDFDTDRKYYYLVWVATLLVLIISQNIVNSRTGRALRAIRDSEAAAESVGINVPDLKVKIFTLSAVYASIAGSLYAHNLRYVSPQTFDFLFSIRLLLMAVVGGLASIWGAIFGTTAIAFLGDALRGFGDLETIVFGFILMAIIIFMPRGLWVHFVAVYKERRDKAGKARS